MIYKPEKKYYLTIDNSEVNDFIRVWFRFNVKAEKLIVKIFQAMGFHKINDNHSDGFKAEKTFFNLSFAENMKAALEIGKFPTTIPYIPSYIEHRTTIRADKYSIAYLLLDEKKDTKDRFLVFETTEELRNSVAWLHAFIKHGKDYPDRSIQVIPRAGRNEGYLLLSSEEDKVARIPNPFGEFGQMLKLDGLDRVPKSELKLLYRKDENLETDNEQLDIFSSQETSRKEDLAVESSQAIARKDELAVESNAQLDTPLSKENTEEQGFARSQEEARKGELAVASLQETARNSEVPNESLQMIEDDEDFENQEKVTNNPPLSKANQKKAETIEEELEPLNELELEDLFKNCFDSLDRLLPDLQKHLERGVINAQSILPSGSDQEVLNFSVIDKRNQRIYLLELEFRTKVSTSNPPVVIQFLIDFEGRLISIDNYLNDPNNPYDGENIEQFISLFKDALEKSLEVGHQFDLTSITIEKDEQKDLESEKTIYHSLLAQAYWRAIDLDENQKFELLEHEHVYHLERLSVVINDYLNNNESFFSDHPSLNNAIDHPTLKNHPFKALRRLYYEEALEEDKLKRIIFICKKLVPKDKAARKGIELILKSIENDSQPLVDLPLLIIKGDQTKPITKKGRVKLNKQIEALIDEKGTESRDYTQEEIDLLSQYSGYGGSKVSEINKGLLYEYYTPDELVRMMWILAREFGYNNGSVLEPSCGTGNFIRYAPIGARIEGYETNKYSATICQLLYPHANIHNKSFETLFFNGNIYLNGNFRTEPFDLVIGNPPYGEFTGTYAGLGEKKRTKAKNYEHYFIKRGLDLLNPDGLLVYVIPNSFLANGNSYNSLKGEIALKCTIEFAFRLSSEVFKHTSIETDIIVLRKRKNRKDGE